MGIEPLDLRADDRHQRGGQILNHRSQRLNGVLNHRGH